MPVRLQQYVKKADGTTLCRCLKVLTWFRNCNTLKWTSSLSQRTG